MKFKNLFEDMFDDSDDLTGSIEQKVERSKQPNLLESLSNDMLLLEAEAMTLGYNDVLVYMDELHEASDYRAIEREIILEDARTYHIRTGGYEILNEMFGSIWPTDTSDTDTLERAIRKYVKQFKDPRDADKILAKQREELNKIESALEDERSGDADKAILRSLLTKKKILANTIVAMANRARDLRKEAPSQQIGGFSHEQQYPGSEREQAEPSKNRQKELLAGAEPKTKGEKRWIDAEDERRSGSKGMIDSATKRLYKRMLSIQKLKRKKKDLLDPANRPVSGEDRDTGAEADAIDSEIASLLDAALKDKKYLERMDVSTDPADIRSRALELISKKDETSTDAVKKELKGMAKPEIKSEVRYNIGSVDAANAQYKLRTQELEAQERLEKKKARQYQESESASERVKIQRDIDKARQEIRKLKAELKDIWEIRKRLQRGEGTKADERKAAQKKASLDRDASILDTDINKLMDAREKKLREIEKREGTGSLAQRREDKEQLEKFDKDIEQKMKIRSELPGKFKREAAAVPEEVPAFPALTGVKGKIGEEFMKSWETLKREYAEVAKKFQIWGVKEGKKKPELLKQSARGIEGAQNLASDLKKKGYTKIQIVPVQGSGSPEEAADIVNRAKKELQMLKGERTQVTKEEAKARGFDRIFRTNFDEQKNRHEKEFEEAKAKAKEYGHTFNPKDFVSDYTESLKRVAELKNKIEKNKLDSSVQNEFYDLLKKRLEQLKNEPEHEETVRILKSLAGPMTYKAPPSTKGRGNMLQKLRAGTVSDKELQKMKLSRPALAKNLMFLPTVQEHANTDAEATQEELNKILKDPERDKTDESSTLLSPYGVDELVKFIRKHDTFDVTTDYIYALRLLTATFNDWIKKAATGIASKSGGGDDVKNDLERIARKELIILTSPDRFKTERGKHFTNYATSSLSKKMLSSVERSKQGKTGTGEDADEAAGVEAVTIMNWLKTVDTNLSDTKKLLNSWKSELTTVKSKLIQLNAPDAEIEDIEKISVQMNNIKHDIQNAQNHIDEVLQGETNEEDLDEEQKQEISKTREEIKNLANDMKKAEQKLSKFVDKYGSQVGRTAYVLQQIEDLKDNISWSNLRKSMYAKRLKEIKGEEEELKKKHQSVKTKASNEGDVNLDTDVKDDEGGSQSKHEIIGDESSNAYGKIDQEQVKKIRRASNQLLKDALHEMESSTKLDDLKDAALLKLAYGIDTAKLDNEELVDYVPSEDDTIRATMGTDLVETLKAKVGLSLMDLDEYRVALRKADPKLYDAYAKNVLDPVIDMLVDGTNFPKIEDDEETPDEWQNIPSGKPIRNIKGIPRNNIDLEEMGSKRKHALSIPDRLKDNPKGIISKIRGVLETLKDRLKRLNKAMKQTNVNKAIKPGDKHIWGDTKVKVGENIVKAASHLAARMLAIDPETYEKMEEVYGGPEPLADDELIKRFLIDIKKTKSGKASKDEESEDGEKGERWESEGRSFTKKEKRDLKKRKTLMKKEVLKRLEDIKMPSKKQEPKKEKEKEESPKPALKVVPKKTELKKAAQKKKPDTSFDDLLD